MTLWVAALGLSIGSFLNVVIARLPRGESVVRPRSRCPRCGHQLPWYENIPVVSWVLLLGKCSGCKAPISPRYVLVELVTGALFIAATSRYGLDWPLVSALVCFSFLVPLIFIDAELWILPFELTLPALAAGLLLSLPQGAAAFQSALLGAVVGFLFFRILEWVGWWVTGREALGAGDKYLLAVIGAQVGWRALFAVILFSSLQGAIVGIIRLRITGRAGPGGDEKVADEKVTGTSGAPAPEQALIPDSFTPAFRAPGLPLWKRVPLLIFTVLLQDIPDPPVADGATGEVPEWQPQANNIPFGPWIGLAGIEVMLLGPWLLRVLSDTRWGITAELILG